MQIEKKFSWGKECSAIVDQRDLLLPPAWIATGSHPGPRHELGNAIHESGNMRAMANAVVALLGQAVQKAVVSSFLLADAAIEEAMLQAATRGVRVYVLLASEARLGAEQGDGEFDKLVLAQHGDMLKKLGGHVLFRSAPHFHAKVVVVDPDTRPAGMLLTANLTKEALQRNEELGIVLETSEVVELTGYLGWAMWESAEHELLDPGDRFKSAKALGKVPHPRPGKAIVATTAHWHGMREELLRLVDGARARIVVSSFGWDEEHDVVQRLCARARAGIEVTVLARLRPASMPALLALAESGATVLAFKWLHAKAIWTDQGDALVMSANLQRHGLDQGFELGVRLNGARAEELLQRMETWRRAAPWTLALRARLGDVSGTVKLWHRGEMRDACVDTLAEVALDPVTASSADALDAPMPAIPREGELPRLAHALRCSWSVVPPALAPKATEQFLPGAGDVPPVSYSPAVFKEPGGRIVVCITSPGELAGAREVLVVAGAAAIVVAAGSAR
jgi:cardiolipin synthase